MRFLTTFEMTKRSYLLLPTNMLLRYFLFLISFLLYQFSALAQEDFLAKQYFNDGDFEKAVVFYEKLVEANPRRTDYAEGLVACYQQLERYDEAENFLLEKLNESYAFPTFYIELGYNHTDQLHLGHIQHRLNALAL